MIDHVSIGVGDVAGSRRFYDAVLKPLLPGLPAEYGWDYYAAFVIDPDGYRIEAHAARAEAVGRKDRGRSDPSVSRQAAALFL